MVPPPVLLEVGGDARHFADVLRRHVVLTVVQALALAALVLEQVGPEGMPAHHLPCPGDPEALLGSLMRSDLRHLWAHSAWSSRPAPPPRSPAATLRRRAGCARSSVRSAPVRPR